MECSPLSRYRIEALWGLAACSRVLVELYRTLRDDKQRDRGTRLGSYGVEQLQRARKYDLGELRRRSEALRGGLVDEVELEHRAWCRGLKAGFELAFLVALGTGTLDRPGLQGTLGQVQRTLGAGILGVATAFPTEQAGPLVRAALDLAEAVATAVLRAQFEDGEEELSPAEIGFLIAEALPPIKDSIWRAVLQLRPDWG